MSFVMLFLLFILTYNIMLDKGNLWINIDGDQRNCKN